MLHVTQTLASLLLVGPVFLKESHKKIASLLSSMKLTSRKDANCEKLVFSPKWFSQSTKILGDK
jgi:hypothetical protein